MTTAIITAFICILAIGVVFIIARRVMRFAIRVALVGILALLLLVGVIVWMFWQTDSPPPRGEKRMPATKRTPAR